MITRAVGFTPHGKEHVDNNESSGKVKRRNHTSPVPRIKAHGIAYFALTILGFSFWFFIALPFASHRETYWWLGMVHSQQFSTAFGFISSTYRPLAQAVTWLAYLVLNAAGFPTNILRQALLQGLVYVMFVIAWWLIYQGASERRLFALLAFVAGGVFFSGYVQLFHVYGIFYVPVILTLGALIHFRASGSIQDIELGFAFVAILLMLWHPFATALFTGFYLGFYLDTFRRRRSVQHLRAMAILVICTVVIAFMVVIFPHITTMVGTFPRSATMPLGVRVLGFLASYQTNEVNHAASLVSLLLTQCVVLSLRLPPRLTLGCVLSTVLLGVGFVLCNLPLLFIWFAAVVVKLFLAKRWSLFFLMLTAVVLPFGGGIGSPMYVLFAIIIAIYATALGWQGMEARLSFVRPLHVAATVGALTIVVLLVRSGVDVPLITRAATPLLAERERTYQLERTLAWLHDSGYESYEIGFAESAGSPVADVENAISRRNRPPAALEDVQLFWRVGLGRQSFQCSDANCGTAIVTFGGPPMLDSHPVFKVAGKYAGDATVWVQNSQR